MKNINNININSKFSEIESIDKINLNTDIANNLTVNLPLIGINYNSKNNYNNIIDYALEGGLCFIHHKCSIDEQIFNITKVKNYLNYIITDPYTITQNVSIKNIKNIMNEKNIGSLLVSNTNNQLLGIITKRDISCLHLLDDYDKLKIIDIMTPFEQIIYTNNLNITLDQAIRLIISNKIKYLPVIDENKIIKGLITRKNIIYNKNIRKNSLIDENFKLKCGATIDLFDVDFNERLDKLINAEVNIILIDFFHAYSKIYIEKLKFINNKYRNKLPSIIVGSLYSVESIREFKDLNINGIFFKLDEDTNLSIENMLILSAEANKYNIPINIFLSKIYEVNDYFKFLTLGYSSCFISEDITFLLKNLENITINLKKKLFIINNKDLSKLKNRKKK